MRVLQRDAGWPAVRLGGGWAKHWLTLALPVPMSRKAGPRSAALCLGPPPPSLYAALSGRPATPHRVRILTAGSGPPLAAYEAEETPTPGLLTLVSDLASSTASSLLGRAAAYVPGRSLLGGLRRGGGSSDSMSAASRSSSAADLAASGQPGQQQQQQGRRKAEKIPGEPATLTAAVWDEKRSVTQMALSPWWVVGGAGPADHLLCLQRAAWMLRGVPLLAACCFPVQPHTRGGPQTRSINMHKLTLLPLCLQRWMGCLLRHTGPCGVGGCHKHPGELAEKGPEWHGVVWGGN